jgi:Fe-S-cluster-containing dehydrogenase component
VAAPLDPAGLDPAGLAELADALRAGRVGAVIAIETDPLYAAPPELELARWLARAPLSVHAAHHAGETTAAAGWVLPLSHYLESWGDGRAWDGTASPIQPLIQPLHDTRSRLELLAMLASDGEPGAAVDARGLVRARWRSELPDEDAWRAMLGEGVIPGTAAPEVPVAPRVDAAIAPALAAAVTAALRPAKAVLDAGLAAGLTAGLEIDLAPSPAVLGGSFANNPWLQELPHPITKLTWGNAALLSAATAQRLGVREGGVLRLSVGGASIDAPALIAPGHADDCITLETGYGHGSPDAPIALGVGVNAFALAGPGPILRAAAAARTGRSVQLARTQQHFDQRDRGIALHADLAAYRGDPEFAEASRGPLPTALAPRRLVDEIPQWAMTIDTTICTGCSSCVIACQAENNVPVVGAEGVRRGREMHWLRIDTYVAEGAGAAEGAADGPAVVHQPMLCQHCEHAPCEYVCPVFATTHSPDGLNEMTYNRCVGTRFCSNNCPYKVRRFNWFDYDEPATLRALQHNPDVTVRARGVMEKCTYCVQRIRAAEIHARMERRPIAPGEVITACQQACPTGAIQFAALQHADTPAMQWRRSRRLYAVLHELGTRPRTMYLAKIRNPEPEDGP